MRGSGQVVGDEGRRERGWKRVQSASSPTGWVVLPGLAVAVAVAALAAVLTTFLSPTVSPVLMAVLLGLAVGNLVSLPPATASGLTFSTHRVLRWGVALLGARLSLTDILGIGFVSLGVVLAGMAIALTTVWIAAKAWQVPPRLAALLAVGTAVCGNSAIVATAPVIEAEDREIGAALATITIFGTVALLMFPAIGHLAGLTDDVFGFWAGLSINDTSQVVAAGASYSSAALEVATVVKLVRNTLMVPVVLALYWWARRRSPSRSVEGGGAARAARGAFPFFVLAFLAFATLRTVGVIGADLASALSTLSTLLITVAIAAVGLSTRVTDLKSVGVKPFVVGLTAATALALAGFVLAGVAVA